jgi:pterin-4a-carbinolamine dehydratase
MPIHTLERNYRAVRFERRVQGLNRIQFRSRTDQHRPSIALD